jgi:hypothetical protein
LALAQTLAARFPLTVRTPPIQLPDFEIALYWYHRYQRDQANKWLCDFIRRPVQGQSHEGEPSGRLSAASMSGSAQAGPPVI